MKIFINNPNESWVVDRFRQEFYQRHPDKVTNYMLDADVIWIIAPWQWSYIPNTILQSKLVVCSIHHLVPEKFDEIKQREFLYRDKFVDAYHVPCKRTRDQLKNQFFSVELADKTVWAQPFWVNDELWKPILEKSNLREKHNLPKDKFLIGSFQRDTEGHDLMSPKLEKGPDLFCDAVEKFHNERSEVEVVLAGWRRQYVMNRLTNAGIPYHYTELPSFETVNELYNCLDLYIVSSRHEGGPQAIFECAATKTPIISTRVGAADYILHESSIYSPGAELAAVSNTEHAFQEVQQYKISSGIDPFIWFLQGVKSYKNG